MPIPTPAVQQAARSGPIYVVLNGRSGNGDTDARCAEIKSVLEAAGRPHEFLVVEPAQLASEAARAVQLARARAGVVVAAGGDGTINTVALAVLGSGVPFGVLPQGTFNLFGRTHGIPEEHAAAVQVLIDGVLTPVQVGRINERIFLVNASLGLYTRVLQVREEDQARFGRSRLVSMASALMTMLRPQQHLDLAIEAAGEHQTVRTLALFAGNNDLQLERVGIEAEHRAALQRGELVATILRPIGRWGMLGLMLRGALGVLGDTEQVQSFGFRTLVVTPRRRRRINVAIDGEVCLMRAPLRFTVATEPLWLLAPGTNPYDAESIDGPGA